MNKNTVTILVVIAAAGIFVMFKNMNPRSAYNPNLGKPTNYLKKDLVGEGLMASINEGECVIYKTYEFNNYNLKQLEPLLSALRVETERMGMAKSISIVKTQNVGKTSVGRYYFITTHDECPPRPKDGVKISESFKKLTVKLHDYPFSTQMIQKTNL